jgi:hypothetical protein
VFVLKYRAGCGRGHQGVSFSWWVWERTNIQLRMMVSVCPYGNLNLDCCRSRVGEVMIKLVEVASVKLVAVCWVTASTTTMATSSSFCSYNLRHPRRQNETY